LTPAVKRHLFSSLFFTWLAALLVLTYYPDLPDIKVRIRDEWLRTDYLGHLGFYAVLMLLFLLWQKGRRGSLGKGFLLWAAAGGAALGALTEATQYFIPGRSVNPFDLMYNCLGIIAGILVYLLVNNSTRMTRIRRIDTDNKI
jgi:VanZ family protein